MSEGRLKKVCGEEVSELSLRRDVPQVTVMTGSYDYTGPDGVKYQVTIWRWQALLQVDWYADETGFHPTLDHMPQV